MIDFDCVLGLFCVIQILVYSITLLPFLISSCKFIRMCIRLRQCVARKKGCVQKFYMLLSPYLCFIAFLYLDLYVFGDDALIS